MVMRALASAECKSKNVKMKRIFDAAVLSTGLDSTIIIAFYRSLRYAEGSSVPSLFFIIIVITHP